jgi:hypothetical protein
MGVGAHGTYTVALPDIPRNGAVAGPEVVPGEKGAGGPAPEDE